MLLLQLGGSLPEVVRQGGDFPLSALEAERKQEAEQRILKLNSFSHYRPDRAPHLVDDARLLDKETVNGVEEKLCPDHTVN